MKVIFHTLEKLKSKFLSFWNKYILGYGKSIKDGYIHNAYSPLIWFVFFLILLLLAGVIFSKNEVFQYIFIILIAILTIFPLIIYIVLLNKDPKLLQSESYRIEDKKLDLIAQQGKEGEMVITTDSITTTEIKGNLEK